MLPQMCSTLLLGKLKIGQIDQYAKQLMNTIEISRELEHWERTRAGMCHVSR